MTIRRTVAAVLAALMAATFAMSEAAVAQKRAVPGVGGGGGGSGWRGGGGGGAGLVGLGIGIAAGIIASQPPAQAAPQMADPPPRRQANTPRTPRRPTGVPPANERRFVPDEVVVEVPNATPAATITAVESRHRLTRLDTQQIPLLGSTLYRFRIPDRSSVPAVIRALEGDRRVASAQPNYLYTLQQQATEGTAATATPKSYGDPAQYAVAKMRLVEAHALAKGGEIRVAVIDSGIDPDHPELAGKIAGKFDTLPSPFAGHAHGTAIAALIAGNSRLMGAAPDARILAARAFDPAGNAAEATTFNIIRALDWSVTERARIINMSFAGPADPGIHRALEAAYKKGIVLIAAAGNAGAKSPPLYPAADPNVIAVTATDSSDQIFQGSNRGRHVTVSAPGVDLLVAVPNGGYQISTGTSYSAAEVSGIAALMLQRKDDLTPKAVRDILSATAKDLGKKGRDDDFGAGMTDAYRAVTEVPGSRVSDALPPK
jgi:subtilisin family serine protease